ncbi:MAG: CBS domain-containing protein [Phycisphaerales bacterium]|nr:CBS domain-containing protein [Phycisphaerales bacterium]
MQLVELGGTRVVTIGPDDSIDEAIALLDANHFRHLPVVDKGRILGMVSDRDLLRAVGMIPSEQRTASHAGPARVGATRISQVMSAPVTTIAADAPADQGASLMLEKNIRALPLVYRDRLAGIVTQTDFLKCYLDDRKIAKLEGWRFRKVGDHMTSPVVTLGPNDTFRHAARVMQTNKFRHVPIVEDGRLVGIVSDRDMRRFLGGFEVENEDDIDDLRTHRPEISMTDVMTRQPKTTHVREALAEVADIMVSQRFGALPVMDEDRIVGIITEADLLRHFVAACKG